MIRHGWCKFRYLVPLLASRGFPLWAKDRLYGSETWPVKEEDVIKLEKNDVWMVRQMCNVRSEDRISAEELRTRL